MFEYTDQEMTQAREMLARNQTKWANKPPSKKRDMQLARQLPSYLALQRGFRLNSKKNKSIKEYIALLQSKTANCLDVFSHLDYAPDELLYIEQRLNFLFESGKIKDDLNLDPFLIRQFISLELHILKLNDKIRKAKTDMAIMRLSQVLSRDSARYGAIKQELGIKEPKETKTEAKSRDREIKQKTEQENLTSFIHEAMKDNNSEKTRIAQKVKDMISRKEARGD